MLKAVTPLTVTLSLMYDNTLDNLFLFLTIMSVMSTGHSVLVCIISLVSIWVYLSRRLHSPILLGNRQSIAQSSKQAFCLLWGAVQGDCEGVYHAQAKSLCSRQWWIVCVGDFTAQHCRWAHTQTHWLLYSGTTYGGTQYLGFMWCHMEMIDTLYILPIKLYQWFDIKLFGIYVW